MAKNIDHYSNRGGHKERSDYWKNIRSIKKTMLKSNKETGLTRTHLPSNQVIFEYAVNRLSDTT